MSQHSTRPPVDVKGAGWGWLEARLREQTRGWIVELVEEELAAALGLERYQRGPGRRGYRNGYRPRTFTTRTGRHDLQLPRGRLFAPEDAAGGSGSQEWHSQLLPRYARRSEQVESAIVLAYLSGTNTRRVARALAPLLEGAALSKSTVSRIVSRLQEEFEAWRGRDLSAEEIGILFLDGFYLALRLGGKVEKVPVLAAVGVRPDGAKVLLGLTVRASESTAAWAGFCQDLADRGLRAPLLAVIDGSQGLRRAVRETWPGIEVQRCTVHKLRNLQTYVPERLYPALKADYHAIVYAADQTAARRAWQRFVQRWSRDCPEAVRSLQEAGEELLTFYRYPPSMWKSLRTTNCVERLGGEFRRRVKTQASLPSPQAGLLLLYGLLASGQVRLRRLDGHAPWAGYWAAHSRAASETDCDQRAAA